MENKFFTLYKDGEEPPKSKQEIDEFNKGFADINKKISNSLENNQEEKKQEENNLPLATNENIANAKAGDKFKRKNGDVITISQGDIDYSKKQITPKEKKEDKQEEKKEVKKEKQEIKQDVKDEKQQEEIKDTAENLGKDITEEVTEDPDNLSNKVKTSPIVGGIVSAYRQGLFGDTKNKEEKKQADKTLAYYIINAIGSAMMSAAGSPTQSQWNKDREGFLANTLETDKRAKLINQQAGLTEEQRAASEEVGLSTDNRQKLQQEIDNLINRKQQIQETIKNLESEKTKANPQLAREYITNATNLLNLSLGSVGGSQGSSFGATSTSGYSGGFNVGYNGIGINAGGSKSDSTSANAQEQKNQQAKTTLAGALKGISQNLADATGESVPVSYESNGQVFYKISEKGLDLLSLKFSSLSEEEKELARSGYTTNPEYAETVSPKSENATGDYTDAIDSAVKGLRENIKIIDDRIDFLREQQSLITDNAKKNAKSNYKVQPKMNFGKEGK